MLTYCYDANPGADDTIVSKTYLPILNDYAADEASFHLGIHNLMSC